MPSQARSDSVGTDSAGVFAVRPDGTGLAGGPLRFGLLDRRPRPEMAAVLTGDRRLHLDLFTIQRGQRRALGQQLELVQALVPVGRNCPFVLLSAHIDGLVIK